MFGNHSVTVAGSMGQFDYGVINAEVLRATLSSIEYEKFVHRFMACTTGAVPGVIC